MTVGFPTTPRPSRDRNGSDAVAPAQKYRSRNSHDKTAMPECLNCGAFVTEKYVRVFAPDGYADVRVCPACEDKVRDGGTVRDARSKRL